MAEFDDEDDALLMHILTLDNMLIEGLMLLANFTEKQVERCCKNTNSSRFNSKFGASPAVICAIYKDLQKTTVEDNTMQPHQSMRLDGSQANLRWLL